MIYKSLLYKQMYSPTIMHFTPNSELAPACFGTDPCSLLVHFAQIRHKAQVTVHDKMPIIGK